ncbi:MAG: galactose-1-phosphate uridylyltransferase [Armatimonadetes bacterium]|nr:galactose-1-phosphate uridylyltransferase [Armatimonadota bacterium]
MLDSQDFPPELRRDPITGIWVIIANRGGRPSSKVEEQVLSQKACPFCPGHEHVTPPEIYAVREGGKPNGPGWQLRVVPNKFKALDIDLPLERQGLGMYDEISGRGAHEVIIETPDHDAQMRHMPLETMLRIIDTYALRLEDLRRDPNLRHIVIFRNYRAIAGASLPHPHSQIIALPIVPKLVKDKLSAAREYYGQRERCIFCDMIRQELMEGSRIACNNDDYVAFVPYAARFPYEVHIFPRRHQHDFLLTSHEQRVSLVEILQAVLSRYYDLLGDHDKEWNVPYNLVLQTAPNTRPRPGKPDYWGTIEYDYHWHIELIPRLTKMAGFEWGTGFYINVVQPERAASELRETCEIAEAEQAPQAQPASK